MITVTQEEPEDLVVDVPVEKLQSYWLAHPDAKYNGKGPCSITLGEIGRAVRAKQLRATPVWTAVRQEHIKRIAYLVVHGWNDPIEIDVAAPSLGYHTGTPITDGHHRIAAATYLGHKTIPAIISGELEYAEELYGIRIQ